MLKLSSHIERHPNPHSGAQASEASLNLILCSYSYEMPLLHLIRQATHGQGTFVYKVRTFHERQRMATVPN